MIKMINNFICILSHSKHYKIKLKGRVLNHVKCDKCGREYEYDRYSTGPK